MWWGRVSSSIRRRSLVWSSHKPQGSSNTIPSPKEGGIPRSILLPDLPKVHCQLEDSFISSIWRTLSCLNLILWLAHLESIRSWEYYYLRLHNLHWFFTINDWNRVKAWQPGRLQFIKGFVTPDSGCSCWFGICNRWWQNNEQQLRYCHPSLLPFKQNSRKKKRKENDSKFSCLVTTAPEMGWLGLVTVASLMEERRSFNDGAVRTSWTRRRDTGPGHSTHIHPFPI